MNDNQWHEALRVSKGRGAEDEREWGSK